MSKKKTCYLLKCENKAIVIDKHMKHCKIYNKEYFLLNYDINCKYKFITELKENN